MLQSTGCLNLGFATFKLAVLSLLFLGCSQDQPRAAAAQSKPARSSAKTSKTKKSKTDNSCSTPQLRLLAGETYEKDIAPLINAKCAWCHSPDAAANRRRTPYLQSFELLKTNVADSINEMNGNSMPPNNVIPRIAAGDAALIQSWVNGGMPQGVVLAAPLAPKSMTYNGFVKEYLRRNCTGCHSPQGGQAPDLSTFELAKGLVSASINSMTQRRMPPGLPALSTSGVTHLQNWMTQGLLLDESVASPTPSPSISPSPEASPIAAPSPTDVDSSEEAADDCEN
jgi:hypothetical protein